MFIFLLFNVVLIVGWGVMFTSVTFQYTFFQWEFFKVMQIVALFLMIGTFATGGWCRVNFGARLDLYRTFASRFNLITRMLRTIR
jgi:hypothetical protein